MSKLLKDTLINTLDRFKRLRIGQIVSDIDSNGEISVSWLDGEPGGQDSIQISFPGYNNTTPQYGVEIGIGKGVVGVFGFITDNHAIFLTSIISKVKNKGVGYDKTQKIQSGEFRITSKPGSKIFLDNDGNITLTVVKNLNINISNNISLTISDDGKISLNTPNTITFTCSGMTVNTNNGVTTL
jgi:hypothetical protein